MVSRPCPRAGQEGCRGVITDRDAPALARRKTCSKACAFRAKLAAGWVPHAGLTREDQRRGARIGGAKSGQRGHRRALERAVAACVDLIPAEFERELSARALALFKVLLGKAFTRGHTLRIRLDDNHRRRSKQPAEKEAAA